MIAPATAVWKWPHNLDSIKFQPQEKEVVDDLLAHLISKWAMDKAPLTMLRKNQIVDLGGKQYKPPVTIVFLPRKADETPHVILKLNSKRGRVLGKGSQRVPKTCYNLTLGCECAKKRIVEKEKLLIEQVQNITQRGLPTIFGICASEGKEQYFEEVYDSTLELRIRKRHRYQDPTAEIKHKYIEDLLEGLCYLHTLKITSLEGTHSVFHNDIKPSNINLGAQGAVLTDFGLSNILSRITGTVTYLSPSTARFAFSGDANDEKKIIQLKMNHGTQSDIWSMGLVVSCILSHRFGGSIEWGRNEIPPLGFVEKRLDMKMFYGPTEDFAKLTQQEADDDVARLRHQAYFLRGAHILVPLWDLAHKMLRVDQNESVSAQEALRRIKAIPVKHACIWTTILDKLSVLDLQRGPFRVNRQFCMMSWQIIQEKRSQMAQCAMGRLNLNC